ncbi:MAG: tRNA 2-thiocytidine biosynthesis protein TtcA [Synergistaceae bacterium]|nr:tRNA 2-thiocytidine biosynthesis protein TtcA [Synergistaceae bacterium]
MSEPVNSLWREPIAKSLRRSVGRAIGDFSMIKEGDRILLGLSGGKDSLILLHALSELRRRSPARFNLSACTVALTGMDAARLESYCRVRDVRHIVLRHPIIEIIEGRNERSPCSFCANMRRGLLNTQAREDGFNKLALGHNIDDAVETFFMNVFRAGRARSFRPKFLQDRSNIEVIRPLVYTSEASIANEARRLELPILPSECPYAGKTERQRTKEMLAGFKAKFPDIFSNVVNALKTIDSSDRWHVEKSSEPVTR